MTTSIPIMKYAGVFTRKELRSVEQVREEIHRDALLRSRTMLAHYT